MKKLVVSLAIATLLNPLALLLPALAQQATLGVVKSPDNEGYWSEITDRLLSTGVDYCIVDLTQVQQASDLSSTQLLFLPNIERLEPSQLAALQDWMYQGGRVIVSGPAGVLSQPEVRNRLRSLLGAYWGFALTQPSSLETSPTDTPSWVPDVGLTGTFSGGVVIPANLKSTAAAVWEQDENPPAVVTTSQSTFLGWRWGVRGVAPVDVDVAWLRAALNRYNVTPGKRTPNSSNYCDNRSPSAETATPPVSKLPSVASGNGVESTVSNPDALVLPEQTPPQDWTRLTPTEVAAMSQELENLIGRFESALLAANATNSDVGLLSDTTAEESGSTSTKGSATVVSLHSGVTTGSASRVVAQARAGLQSFLNAARSQDYTLARQEWLHARRLLWDNYPIDRKLAQPEIRAIWLDRGTIVKAKSERDLARIFDQLAAAGLNTVFFETVNASYPIYPSRVASEQNPLIKGWDPLKAAVKLAHERGMELHAWVWIFAAANQRHNALLNQSADYLGPVLSAHPDWAMVDKQGRLFDGNTKKAFLDPANLEVRRYLMALLEEIANNYEVDGIQLDYIRYPFQDPRVNQTYGYGMAARQQFQEMTGVDPIEVYPGDSLWERWTQFRVRQVDSFVASVSARLRSQHPNLILSAAVFALPRVERLQRLQQNWENWAIRGDIDLVVPMTYALDTEGLQNLAQPLLREPTLSSALLLPGIRLLNLPNIVAVDQIQLLRDLPAGGYALFAVENLDENLRGIFNRTQGSQEEAAVEVVPYRQPFKAAAARYASLQREWSFLLTRDQMAINPEALSEWVAQAEVLSTALDQLATEPSKSNWLSAKMALSSFRSQFQKWMQEHTPQQAYQVQVWHDRLEIIERLLNYGDRRGSNRDRLTENNMNN
ncbi:MULTISPECIES: glycoside hydrolase family 10 protein [unclassified Coleofasciculus]|uniref:glycoside hydrolase family 10 protein n=1 Tax=unclassified Coleofasciculus TaxID=2692782 RepID=UPI00187F8AA5|nr:MULTISPECIES: family 10 glycosylhydrolase [unclassified Coleofasciculus]MBE9124585.1 family 10 glycosylhydrolase [Coleofasciculus sp. LEGE 07081]MBE9150374.1 family 10 glycosylhydrolase [Coleofasciculus sp. LEGE 07092]